VTTAVPTCEWVVAAPGWIHSQPSLGTGNATLVLQVDPSTSTRQATIYIGTGSALVEQASSTTDCSATLRVGLTSFDDAGGHTMAQVTSSVAGCDWTIQADPWIHLSQSSGTGNATVPVQVDPTDRSRAGSVLLVVHTPAGSKYSSVPVSQTSRVVLPLTFTSATCGSIQAGGPSKPSLCYFVLAPGTNPASTNVRVFADLRPVGGRDGVQLLKEMGTGGLEFSLDLSVPASVSPGGKVIPLTAYDGQGRTATESATLTVLPPTSN
jgi:hypothetical protein